MEWAPPQWHVACLLSKPGLRVYVQLVSINIYMCIDIYIYIYIYIHICARLRVTNRIPKKESPEAEHGSKPPGPGQGGPRSVKYFEYEDPQHLLSFAYMPR